MHRSTLAVLASAAIVGLTSGVGAGIWESRTSDAASPTSEGSPAASATPEPERERDLLYATDTVVVDGPAPRSSSAAR